MTKRDTEKTELDSAMAGVEPLKPAVDRRPRSRRSVAPVSQSLSVQFEIQMTGEEVRGLAPGASSDRVWKLERGKIAPTQTLDLHGREAREARHSVRRLILRISKSDRPESASQCVRIIHGRGMRSQNGPVLKTALPQWLGEPPIGDFVEAFCTAPPELGSTGATLVLLWRVPHAGSGP